MVMPANARLVPVESGDPRVVGGRYWCGYWRQIYSVLAIRRGSVPGVRHLTVRWEGDLSETTHCTAWDFNYDRVIG